MGLGKVRWIAAAIGLFLLVLGLWALISPRSFYEQLATYPPYNVHLFHDVGAFQAGLGAVLLLALWRADVLGVTLLGVGVGNVLHFISHVVDRDLGGKPSDPVLLGLLALVTVAAAVLALRRPRVD
jgi:hypothetical protein